jgi:RNA polymerase sigma factor (sigma-70 family)
VNTAQTIARRATYEAAGEASVAEVEMNGQREASVVQVWVSALPERQRLAVFLRYWADLDYRAIADALEIEVGTVSATLSAAHQRLRRSLQEAPK